MDYDVIIVGAGPAGSYSAARIASLGYRTALIEDHPEAGRPQQCAGLVNPKVLGFRLLDRIGKSLVLKQVHGADIYSPSGTVLPLRGNDVKAISIDRAALDKELLRLAARCGAEVLTSQKVISIEKLAGKGWKVFSRGFNGDMTSECSLLLGCDGPYSMVRRSAGIGRPRETLTGIAIEVQIDRGKVPGDKVGLFTGSMTAKGFFAWAIPTYGENGVRLGASSIDPNGLMNGFRSLLSDRRLADHLSLDGPEDIRFGETAITLGPIPMGSPERLVSDRLVLLGDSAGMAKPTSGGGIFPSLMAADLLCSKIEATGSLTQLTIEGFEKDWDKGYGREMERAFVARKVLSDIKDDEIDMALERLSRRETLDLINREGDIDHPMALAVSLVRRDPGLLMLLPRYFPHLKKVL